MVPRQQLVRGKVDKRGETFNPVYILIYRYKMTNFRVVKSHRKSIICIFNIFLLVKGLMNINMELLIKTSSYINVFKG